MPTKPMTPAKLRRQLAWPARCANSHRVDIRLAEEEVLAVALSQAARRGELADADRCDAEFRCDFDRGPQENVRRAMIGICIPDDSLFSSTSILDRHPPYVAGLAASPVPRFTDQSAHVAIGERISEELPCF